MRALTSALSLIALASACSPALAGSDTPQPDADQRAEVAKKIGAKPDELRPSPVDGIYEYAQGTDIGYVTDDGRYFFGGDLYEVEKRVNLTDARRSEVRQKLLAAVPESEMIVFAPAATKYTITVFTDVDCGYCRKLHSEIRELNNLGVRVRYMFYPRSGPGTESWKTAEAVWCSKNRNDALTRAKKGEAIEAAKSCGATPVMRQWQLGEELGVRGTPGIFTNKGSYISGYAPPAQLLAQIKANGG
jgi:thiol:disulfide interchange protein DsbC